MSIIGTYADTAVAIGAAIKNLYRRQAPTSLLSGVIHNQGRAAISLELTGEGQGVQKFNLYSNYIIKFQNMPINVIDVSSVLGGTINCTIFEWIPKDMEAALRNAVVSMDFLTKDVTLSAVNLKTYIENNIAYELTLPVIDLLLWEDFTFTYPPGGSGPGGAYIARVQTGGAKHIDLLINLGFSTFTPYTLIYPYIFVTEPLLNDGEAFLEPYRIYSGAIIDTPGQYWYMSIDLSNVDTDPTLPPGPWAMTLGDEIMVVLQLSGPEGPIAVDHVWVRLVGKA